MRYRFDDCVLDGDSVQLFVAGQEVRVEPQVFDVLRLLVDERHRLVPKEEILDRVWGHTFVTESALTSRIKSARRAIGDDGQEQRLIRTVHGRGYQFVGDVDIENGTLDAEHARPATPDPIRAPRRLPVFASALVGREGEIAEIGDMLDRHRLVTLVGPGGVGKTRLAIACAAAEGDRHVAFADLTTVRDPALVVAHIASEMGVHTERSDPMAAICEYVAGRPLLLVVDNVEHVIAAAPDIGELLHRSSDLAVLATSRERLRLDGEHVVDVEPLSTEASVPGADPDAVELFAAIARSVAPGFDADRYHGAIADICEAVDGLPLAIELVASQTRTLPPDELAARLHDRLHSASAPRRDAPARHRTMSATIDWSLLLLDADESRLFVRLGAFVGAVPLGLVESVCSDERLPAPVDVLTRLVDKSLVRTRTGADGGVRFGMLELLRARACELLSTSDDRASTAQRHAEAVAARVEEIERRRWAELVATWADLLTELVPEVRRSFEWAVAHDDWELAGRLAAAFGFYWHREGGLAEGRRRLEAVLDHEPDLTTATRGRALAAIGLVAWDQGDVLAARERWLRAAEELEAGDDPARLAFVLTGLAVTALDEPARFDWARTLLDRAVSVARTHCRPAALAEVLNMHGEFDRGVGDDELARAYYVEAATLAADVGDFAMQSVALANLCYIECHEGRFEDARRLGRTALRMCSRRGRRLMSAWSVGELAIPACGLQDYELAARLIGAANRAIETLGSRRHPADVLEDDRVRADLVERLGPDEFDRLTADGARLSLDEAVALALGEESPT